MVASLSSRSTLGKEHDPADPQLDTPTTYEKQHADISFTIGRTESQTSKKSEKLSGVEVDVEDEGEGDATVDIQDPNVVWWDGPEDPENPMNWPSRKKAGNVMLVSMLCFVTPLASSMFAPGVPSLMKEFHSDSSTLGAFVVSVYILGFAFGPILLAPLSELYGRVPVYHVTNALFVIFNISCALSTNLNMLIGFRFLAGMAGSACLTNGGGTIADLIAPQKRGLAMSMFVVGPLLGPVVGPVAGGYCAEYIGWRWVFYILAIVTGTFSIGCLIFLRESFAPIILGRKAMRLRKQTGNEDLRSKLDSGLSPRDFFVRGIIRPSKLLAFSPIVLILSIYMGIVYGYLYLLFTTFSMVFAEQYGFATSSVGLSFLGMGIGSIVGLGVFGFSSDKLLTSIARRNSPPGTPDADLVFKPEYRLPPMFPGSLLIPAGLFIYGWTAEYKVHYIVPMFGTLLVGIGNLAVFMCIQTYMVDAFTIYAASALAANTIIRCILGAVLPLAGEDMYKTLGVGWGNSLLAFIALGLGWVPWAVGKWGERIRLKYPVNL